MADQKIRHEVAAVGQVHALGHQQGQRHGSSGPEEGAQRHQEGRPHQQEGNGPERRAGRQAQQIGIGQRIACQRLHHRATERQTGAHRRGGEDARQAQFPDDGVAQATNRAFGQEAEVMADGQPHFGGSDIGRPKGHRQHQAGKEKGYEAQSKRDQGRSVHGVKLRPASWVAMSAVAPTLRTPASAAGNGTVR